MSTRKNKCSSLTKKAKSAKKRLVTGYWDIVNQRKEIALTIDECVGMDKAAINEYCRETYGADQSGATKVVEMLEDEMLYKKVSDILRSDEVISNPIGLLVDKEKMSSLDERGRTSYVLKMSQKYRELCDRYNAENRG